VFAKNSDQSPKIWCGCLLAGSGNRRLFGKFCHDRDGVKFAMKNRRDRLLIINTAGMISSNTDLKNAEERNEEAWPVNSSRYWLARFSGISSRSTNE
jgi:hypothetical protein